MLKIRRAKPEDKQSLRNIYACATGSDTTPNNTYLEELMNKGGLLVAEQDDQVIGFGGVDVEATEQIKYLYVLPGHQNGGAGSKILREMEEVGWQTGVEWLRLHSSPSAVEFYKRRGYRAVGDEIGHDHEGVEMIKDKR